MNLNRITLISACLFALLAPVASAQSQDVVTVGTVVATSGVVDVPVYIRDASSTPLGIDQPAGSRIQSWSLKVNYAPTSAVQSVTFTRAGISAPLTPTFESSPSAAGTISLLDNFAEATNLVPFTSNAPVPGNLVGHLTVTLAPGLPAGTVVTLTLDPTLTQLTDEGGTAATAETVANSRLALVAGAITVANGSAPTLGEWGLALLALSLGFVAVRLRL